MTGAGSACDTNGSSLDCYPAPNTLGLGDPCGSPGAYCAHGLTCGSFAICVEWCCTQADCTQGTCSPHLGIYGANYCI